ncbi:zinc ABC transporter substrate-binding protein [Candidatus Uhrbacteria bacterium]|nr:zinc ABC transporter substrate-binding protein [Candidatus Uhrbacteria bacterium]
MKKDRRLNLAVPFLIFAVAATAMAVFLPKSKGTEGTDSERPKIMVTVHPAYDVVRGVAGDVADTVLLMPPGSSPHTFDPTPTQVGMANGAAVAFAIGQGLDDWIESISESAGLETVTLDTGIRLLPSGPETDGGHKEEGHDDEDEDSGHHHHGHVDPHYWLDPHNIKVMADNAYRELAARWPEHADRMRVNLNAYKAGIDRADTQAMALLSPLQERDLVTLHDGWRYFARAYGLNLVGSFEPSAGREPTPKYLFDLSSAVRESGVRVLYAEPQLSTTVLEPFIRDNGLTLAVLDPLGGSDGRDTLSELITYNARTIAQNQ